MQIRRKLVSGLKMNSLTAIRKVQKGNATTSAKWECLCECGNTFVAKALNILRGHRTSCGCRLSRWQKRFPYSYGASKDPERYATTTTLNRYKSQAKSRGFCWELTRETCEKLFKSHCFYCGVEPLQICTPIDGRKIAFKYNGIDRVHSSIGYVDSNVVPCCGTCNRAKSNRDITSFLEWVKKVYFHAIAR